MEKVRWGIIGCGDVTEVKSSPGFQKADNSELVAVMRRNGDLAEDYTIRHGVPKWYDDVDELINDPEVNAIYIATPPAYHKDHTLKCAKAQKPVYVDKPMAFTYEDSKIMIDACKKHEVPLFVAFYRRGLPRFLKIKELIHRGVIGDVQLQPQKTIFKRTKVGIYLINTGYYVDAITWWPVFICLISAFYTQSEGIADVYY